MSLQFWYIEVPFINTEYKIVSFNFKLLVKKNQEIYIRIVMFKF